MRDVLPFIFWPWLVISCTILMRRRIGGGSWRATSSGETAEMSEAAGPVEFPPPPRFAPVERPADVSETVPAPVLPASASASVAVAAPAAAPPAGATRARTLAEALDGIAMPCDLSPLVGSAPLDARRVAFSTTGFEPAAVGVSLSDEFERLGFQISPESERSIRAKRDEDVVRAKIVSAVLDSEAVMADLHPSASEGALVVELSLD